MTAPTLDVLKRSAAESAQWRGHTLGPWDVETVGYVADVRSSRSRATADCTNCGRGVAVDTHPPPNGIDVAGEAVAVGCTIDNIEHAFAKFGPRIKTFLEGVRERVNDTGITGGDIWKLDEEYGYELAWPALGVRLLLADAAEYEGVDEGEEGLLVNVMLDAIASGGAIIVSFAPYNYTPDVWVDLRKEGAVNELARRIEGILEFEGNVALEILPTLREAEGGWPE